MPEQAGFRVVETTPNCYHSLDARDKAGNLRYSRTTNWFYNLEDIPAYEVGHASTWCVAVLSRGSR